MSNKEGSNFTFGDIKQEGTGHAVVDQSEGKTITVNNGDSNPWTDVYDYVTTEVPEDARDAVSAAVIDLQEKVESEADVSEFDSILEILKPYKPLGDLLVKAAPGIASMVTAAFA